MSVIHEYLRPNKKFPHVWCAGCGHGTILACIIRAIHTLELDRNKVILVSGIGCSSRAPVYVDFNTLHTTHGRALSFATGVKMAKPELKVIVITGDGDAVAIGGNHFIHSCRRNIDITTVVFNNSIYGMTGGQVSPTTPEGQRATTAPYGKVGEAFDVCQLASGAGATFVARGTAMNPRHLEKLLVRGISHQGFTVIEAISQCPTIYGRINKQGGPVEMLKWQKDHSITVESFHSKLSRGTSGKDSPSLLEGKFLTGVFTEDNDVLEFCSNYELQVKQLTRKRRFND